MITDAHFRLKKYLHTNLKEQLEQFYRIRAHGETDHNHHEYGTSQRHAGGKKTQNAKQTP